MTTLANDRMVFIHIPKTGGTWGTWAMQSAGVEFEKIGDTHHLMKRGGGDRRPLCLRFRP